MLRLLGYSSKAEGGVDRNAYDSAFLLHFYGGEGSCKAYWFNQALGNARILNVVCNKL